MIPLCAGFSMLAINDAIHSSLDVQLGDDGMIALAKALQESRNLCAIRY
jgi:hypothetical protein